MLATDNPPMRRSLSFICAAVFLLAACGESTLENVPASSSTTNPPDSTVTTAAPAVATYRYEMSFVGQDFDGTEVRVSLTGAVDEDRQLAEIRYLSDTSVDGPVDSIIVQTSNATLVYAPIEPMLPSWAGDDIEPDQWYEFDVFENSGADAFFLKSTPTSESIWELLGVQPQSDIRDGRTVEVAVVDGERLTPHRGSNSVFSFIGINVDRVEIVTSDDEDGGLAWIALNSTGDEQQSSELTIAVSDRGQPVDIEIPTQVEPLPLFDPPTLPPPVVPTTLLPEPTIEPDSDGVFFRLSVTGGWQLPDPPARRISLETDGSLVRAINPNVFASTESFSVMQLSPSGVNRVIALFEDSGLLENRGLLDGGAGISPTSVSATLWVGGRPILSMDRIGETEGYDEEQRAARAAFDDILAKLDDPSWLGDDILSDWQPWVPERLTVLASDDVSPRSGLPNNSPFADWPLAATIEEMSTGTVLNAYDEEVLVICLEGKDVAPVWALLTGVNNAYLRVDDGREWELTYALSTPGYRSFRDAC